MPVQTAIQVRRGTASSWTSTNPTLAAGEIGFETDTGKFKIGTGSTAWASLAYAAIDAGLLAAKGDLVTATANDTPAVLTVGSNGDTLVADSSASTGLRWQGNFAAGKNKVINGDFGIWQRGTSFTTGNGAYVFTADRWRTYFYGSNTTSVTQQTFTAGTAPVAGYEGQYFLRISSSNTQIYLEQQIEDVRTFAGQTVTFSMWVKQNTAASTALGVTLVQYFGTGGSANVNTTILSSQSTTTGWVRLTGTATLPSISGKTLGTGHYLAIQISNGSLNNALDIWGVQLEAGNVATAFQTATGTLAGELAACQRYYWRWTAGDAYTGFGLVIKTTTTAANWYLQNPVEMRARPSSLEFSTLMLGNGAASAAVTAMTLGWWSKNSARIDITNNAFGAGDTPAGIFANNSTSAYFAINAEL